MQAGPNFSECRHNPEEKQFDAQHLAGGAVLAVTQVRPDHYNCWEVVIMNSPNAGVEQYMAEMGGIGWNPRRSPHSWDFVSKCRPSDLTRLRNTIAKAGKR
jgi:hypothetical protein